MNLFSEATQKWFTLTFGQPTPVQSEAWPAIASGNDALVSAPTGTGKTLAAFLVFVDKFVSLARGGELENELQLIYISPLKSLARDISENLRKPLEGVAAYENAASLVRVGVRTGDTTPQDRRAMLKRPPHILITTPESLYILLSSASGSRMLSSARAIIVDELHAIIDTKRGSHLMFSIARLDALSAARQRHTPGYPGYSGYPAYPGYPDKDVLHKDVSHVDISHVGVSKRRAVSLQRIGLSATIEPLDIAANYLSPKGARIITPKIEKKTQIRVISPMPETGVLANGTIWPDIARHVCEACVGARCVIAFVESRANAEKLAYLVNETAGEGFALAHHGSISKERRETAEQALKDGSLRLLCATSSMELGIDVGDIDLILQIGCPGSVSSLLQRLGRSGHNPGRASVMRIYPRTSHEGLNCGIMSKLARDGVIEPAKPPRGCLDVLAQHLVSMASAAGEFSANEAVDVMKRAYPFRNLTKNTVMRVLKMLAADREHAMDIPVRPRLLFDRINEVARGDSYSRLLALNAGGTIPNRGLYPVRNESGVRLGEVEEEFVFEARVGDKFLLGAFAWKIVAIKRDEVVVSQSGFEGAQPPFWKGDMRGRGLRTALAFGETLRDLHEAAEKFLDSQTSCASAEDPLLDALGAFGMDAVSANNAKDLILRQIESTGALPDDRTIIVERFKDEFSDNQLVVHSIFGRAINAPLAILARETARAVSGVEVELFEDDDGFLLTPADSGDIPEGLLLAVDPDAAETTLRALLPAAPVFGMTFRYNAARALMMGPKLRERQPLWIQRARGARLLSDTIESKDHPLIAETVRECMEDFWDVEGLIMTLRKIRDESIKIIELRHDMPSPMSLPLRRKAESVLLYDYFPVAQNVKDLARSQTEGLACENGRSGFENANGAYPEHADGSRLIAPDRERLQKYANSSREPKNEHELHAQLMTEGDIIAGESRASHELFLKLAAARRAFYIEPGLWIAAEQKEEYEKIGQKSDSAFAARLRVTRRALRYRGGHTAERLARRYAVSVCEATDILESLREKRIATLFDGTYYHAELFERARLSTVLSRRAAITTQPPERYAALLAERAVSGTYGAFRAGVASGAPTPTGKLESVLRSLIGRQFPAEWWESTLLPARTPHYRRETLDATLAIGGLIWKLFSDGSIAFYDCDDIDWDFDAPIPENIELTQDETALLGVLSRRGAAFSGVLAAALSGLSPYDALLGLVRKGLVRSDGFEPIRHIIESENIAKANVKQRALSRSRMLISGRWELVRPLKAVSAERELDTAFDQMQLLCKETASSIGLNWTSSLEILRAYERTGRARRGYYVDGLSGAQFARERDFARVSAALARTDANIVWLPAVDQNQPWGKCLPHMPGRAFMNAVGVAVCLAGGVPIAVFERKGMILRFFEPSLAKATSALKLFAEAFSRRQLYPERKYITVKEYPPEAVFALESAGFTRQVSDYALYRR